MEFKRWHYDSSVPQMLRYTGASARGITENGIITDSSIEESAVKKQMMKNSAKSYFLCDSSKIGQKYMYNVADAKEIDGMITELPGEKESEYL